MEYTEWFKKLEQTTLTADGKTVEAYSLNHINDPILLKEWAIHFREHYVTQPEIAERIQSLGISAENYLLQYQLPPDGPILSGDFAEILVADFWEYLQGYRVFRYKYREKGTPLESKRGSDVLAFKMQDPTTPSPLDDLLVCEVKGSLDEKAPKVLQNAVDHLNKDITSRMGTTLVKTLELVLKYGKDVEHSRTIIERFQQYVKRPYRKKFAAVAVVSNHCFDEDIIKKCTTEKCSEQDIILLIVTGEQLYELARAIRTLSAIC